MQLLRSALQSHRLFEGIRDEGLDRIASIATEESHAPDAFVFREGEPGDRLYLILEGKVRVSRQMPGMGEEALAVLGPGEAFGEMSLFDDAARSADARVQEPCRLLALRRDAFEELLLLDRDIAYEILWNMVRVLTGRLRDTNDEMTFLSLTGRF